MAIRGLMVVTLLASAACLAGCGRSAETKREIAALNRQVAALSLQVQANKDWTQIANLQASYGYYVDKMRWDDAADLFVKNATLEIAGRGLFNIGLRI